MYIYIYVYIYVYDVCAVSLVNHLRASANVANVHVRGKLHESEVLLMASTLLVVKAKMETEFSH